MTHATGYEPLNTLKPVARDLWLVDGPIIRFYGLPFPTRMVVVRLPDDSLWIHSPIAPDPGLIDAVRALGRVAHLVAPNWIHYAYVQGWQTRFPDARTWAAPGVVRRARSRGVALRAEAALDTATRSDFLGVIEPLPVEGSAVHREVVFMHHPSRTLILTDLIENFERRAIPAWMAPLTWLGGIQDPDGKMPIDMALSFRRARGQLRAAVETMIGWNPERVIMAHGRWYDRDGVAELRRAFRKVLRQGGR